MYKHLEGKCLHCGHDAKHNKKLCDLIETVKVRDDALEYIAKLEKTLQKSRDIVKDTRNYLYEVDGSDNKFVILNNALHKEITIALASKPASLKE